MIKYNKEGNGNGVAVCAKRGVLMDGAVLNLMVEYFGADIKRINHALKVYGFAKAIAYGEKLDIRRLDMLEAAAALHDIGIKTAEEKYHSSSGVYQEMEGPPIAREMLKKLGYGGDFADRVCFLIGHHHSYDKIDGLDFQILIEADLIVNIDEEKLPEENAVKLAAKYFRTKTGLLFIKNMMR